MIIETPPPPKRRLHGQPEAKIQSESYQWFHNTFPQYRGLLFACTNQNERSNELSKHSQLISGAMRKNMGVWHGVSDMLFLVPKGTYHALLLEAKTPKGTQSVYQQEWERKVTEQGYLYKIFRSVEEFKEIIQWYLNL